MLSFFTEDREGRKESTLGVNVWLSTWSLLPLRPSVESLTSPSLADPRRNMVQASFANDRTVGPPDH